MKKEHICPQCNSIDIGITDVDEREMYECASCRKVWYAERVQANGTYAILDEITESVEKNGCHEIPLTTLGSTAFRKEKHDKWNTQEQILIFAVQNRLWYEYDERTNGTMVRFFRDKKYKKSQDDS